MQYTSGDVKGDPKTYTSEELLYRKALEPGEVVILCGCCIRRGGEHDKGITGRQSLYFAVKDGLCLHYDLSWHAGTLNPKVPKPASASMLTRADLTGSWDDLASIVAAVVAAN